MSAPINPTTNVAYRVLDALGYGADPDRARLIVAMWARPVRRLSVAECREVLAVVDAAAPAVPEQRHTETWEPGEVRRGQGARYGGVDETGEVHDGPEDIE